MWVKTLIPFSCVDSACIPAVTNTTVLLCKVCNKAFNQRKLGSRQWCSRGCRMTLKANQQKIRRRKLDQSPKETYCAECGVWFTTLVRTSAARHYCSGKCMNAWTRKQSKHVRRERQAFASGEHRGVVSLAGQYAKFNGVCQICGCMTEMRKDYSRNQATVDHKIPLSRGGQHVESNVHLTCHSCNSVKSDKVCETAPGVVEIWSR